MTRPRRDFLGRLLIMSSGICGGVIFGVLQFLPHLESWPMDPRVIESFACLGLLFGAILTFDANSPFDAIDRPAARIMISAFAGVLLGLSWRWPGEGVLLSAIVFGGAGLLGMVWVRFV